jgi:hypothetical protein
MAGQPKTQARRLAKIEEQVFQLNVDLIKLRPAQYAAREGTKDIHEDPVCFFWNESVRAIGMTMIAVNALLGFIEEKAGLDAEALEHERMLRRGMLPENATDTAEKAPT